MLMKQKFDNNYDDDDYDYDNNDDSLGDAG